MSNLVIVAIPDENDRVWKVSSEKIPHLTLLFLGDVDQVANSDQIVQFVEHAANTTLRRFYLPVDRRDEIGDGKADVLHFKRGRYDFKAVRDFRVQLLKNNAIRTAYDSAEQHDGPWKPHLTLGYPSSPAKTLEDDYPFYDVSFNKIAVWFGEYEGPEFLIKDFWEDMEGYEIEPGMAEPTMAMAAGSEEAEQFMLAHYGVKGMKWGVNRAGETKREGIQQYLDPQGHKLGTDVTKIAAGLLIPVLSPLTIPAQARLVRGAIRDSQTQREKRQDAKFEKVAKSQETFVAIHNGASDRINRDIGNINKKYTEADLANPTKKKAYDAEVQTLMQDAYRASANELGNKTGTKHLDVEFRNDGNDFAVKVKDGPQTITAVRPVEKVKHAAIDDDDVVSFIGKLLRNASGHILDLDFEDFDKDLPTKSELAQAAEDGAEFLLHKGMMDPDYFLEHFGVKGMRWGVRKEDIASVGNAAKSFGGKVGKAASATDKFVRDVNFEAKLDSPEKKEQLQHEIYTKAGEAFKRTDLPAIKEKPEYQKAKKTINRLRHPRDPATKAYRKEVKAAYIQRLEDAANSMTNASGTRQYTIRERGWEAPPEGGALPKSKNYWDVSSREVKHADGEITTAVEVIMDEDGFITDLRPEKPADSMAQSMAAGLEFLVGLGISVDEGELEHYGVKGMRWGQRNSDRPAPVASHPTGTSVVPHGNKRKTKIEVEGGQNHEAHPDAIKIAEARAKLKKSGTAALSNTELQEVARRLQLEGQVAQLTSNRANKFITRQLEQQGQQAVQYGVKKGGKKALKKAGKAAATGAVTLALL